ncbi:hypothetical protein [Frigoribacterium endophyticum]|uniref:hypothetical protein n=1 Tax=Frigoribacterium endophyticum TaxID=1522176 RepID=UPI001420B546|nr:hypothetical protein [Frigoribacterium endophyticum]NII52108.1 hypothetical protein [Frigoribacterium endophyticum]
MDRPRVVEVANEAKTDVRTAMAALRRLGVEVAGPTVRIDGDVADQLRIALGRPSTAAIDLVPPADVPARKLPMPIDTEAAAAHGAPNQAAEVSAAGHPPVGTR